MVYAVVVVIRRKMVTAKAAVLYGNLVLCIIIPFVLLVRYAYTIDYQAQGRYVLPSLVPLMYIICKSFDVFGSTFKYKEKIPVWVINVVEAVSIFVILFICYDMVFVQSIPIFKNL